MNEQAACIVCGTVPDAATGRDWQPYAATEFQSRGNYGSTVFDMAPRNTVLFINVCDRCLIERQGRVHEREAKQGPTTFEVRQWVP